MSRSIEDPARMREMGALTNAPTFVETTTVARQSPVVQTMVLADESLASEEFRVLATKVLRIGEERSFRCIGVVSATAGEGKSTISLGLAAALAKDPEHRVFLIDCDLRKPALEDYLGLPQAPGLRDWLGGSSSPVPVRHVVPHGFTLLSAGRRRGSERPEFLRSARMRGLLDEVLRSHSYVLLDCPPLTPVADAALLQDLVDGFLLVVRARYCPRESVVRAASRLRDGRIAGAIFNDPREILPGYHSYGYKRYGEVYGRWEDGE